MTTQTTNLEFIDVNVELPSVNFKVMNKGDLTISLKSYGIECNAITIKVIPPIYERLRSQWLNMKIEPLASVYLTLPYLHIYARGGCVGAKYFNIRAEGKGDHQILCSDANFSVFIVDDLGKKYAHKITVNT